VAGNERQQTVTALAQVQAMKHTRTQEQQKYNIIIHSLYDHLISTELLKTLHWI